MSRFSSLCFPYSKKNEMPEKCPCFYHFLFIKTNIINFFFFYFEQCCVPNNSPISDQLQESDFIYQFSFETKYKRPFDFRLLSKMILEAFLTFVFYFKDLFKFVVNIC